MIDRTLRPCEICCFWHDIDGWNPYCDMGDWQSRVDEVRDRRKKIPPCDNHYTVEEMQDILKRRSFISGALLPFGHVNIHGSNPEQSD